MVPKAICCDDCGETAVVRSSGRIEYDWPNTTTVGSIATIPTISSIRLTIDCPNCGVKQQEFHPNNAQSLNTPLQRHISQPSPRPNRPTLPPTSFGHRKAK